MMLWKCYTQYASKFGKLKKGHRTGKGKFPFQSQRKAISKNAQITTQLHSFHTLSNVQNYPNEASTTWTMNFQMFKPDLEKAEEPEINCLHLLDHWKKQESSRKPSTIALLTMQKSLTVENCQELGIPDHLTCLLRNLYAGQEATVRTGHGTADWFQIGKGVCHGCILSPCLLNLYAEYIMQNSGLDETQAGIKIAGRNINNLRYADDTILWQKAKKN